MPVLQRHSQAWHLHYSAFLHGQRNTCKIEQAQNISFWSSIFFDVRLDLMSAMYTGGSVKHVELRCVADGATSSSSARTWSIQLLEDVYKVHVH